MTGSENRKWIVYFASGNYWSGGVTGRHHLLKRLAKDHNILFVNSLGLASIKTIKKNTILKRVFNKLKSWTKYLKKDGDFHVFSPVNFSIGIKKFDSLNNGFINFQFRRIFKKLGIEDPFVLISNPKAALVLRNLKTGRIIYNYSDKFKSYREISDGGYIAGLDEELKKKADIIICNLRKTFDELSETEYKEKIHYLPHSVDFEMFNSKLNEDFEPPQDMKGIKHPVFGYYGTLTDSNDWEMIRYCAKERPGYSFVFIGHPRADIDNEVRSLPNVHFLGYKQYETLPYYLKFFDVCIMFWKVTDWIYNSNPLKTKEFLAMGKPVVSVKIYELEKNFSDLIALCSNKEEFLAKMDEELKNDSKEKQQKRIGRVKDNSWEKDAAEISKLLES
jgi:hypothetical protein